ncbi:MAG TPA: Xaa-Pro peptidase family protein [Tepidisphaeraceae bacterium]|jgi:Xaa-Pro dipeptidase
MLDPQLARQRQRDVLAASPDCDALLITMPHHVMYLTAHHPGRRHTPALLLRADGHATLIAANGAPKHAAADDVRPYVANANATLRQDQAEAIADLLADRMTGLKRVGYDRGVTASVLLPQYKIDWVNIDSVLWQRRRRKDADELELMRRAIDATRAMYARARQLIAPGVPEIEIYNRLHAAAVESMGEAMTSVLGNDYACGVGGGPARQDRDCVAGELYVLDLGPSYRGYHADNCRVIAVDRKPTDVQVKAWQNIADVFPIIESMAKPGVRCRDLHAAIEAHFQARFGRGQAHHLGHGVGLEPHEFPHLNPHWDDVLIEGEIFTCEPGIYREDLRSAIRLENQYRVTADGVENLTPFSLAMA